MLNSFLRFKTKTELKIALLDAEFDDNGILSHGEINGNQGDKGGSRGDKIESRNSDVKL